MNPLVVTEKHVRNVFPVLVFKVDDSMDGGMISVVKCKKKLMVNVVRFKLALIVSAPFFLPNE